MTSTYVSHADLIARFDPRDIKGLVVDDSSDPNLVDLATNHQIGIALSDAEGEVIAALRKAGKYDVERLAALTGVDLDYLKRIICEIAMVHLFRRRPSFAPEAMKVYEDIRRGTIKDLQDGHSVLSANEPADTNAGRVNNEGPSVAQWYDLNLWRDRSNYFPQRY